jgi:cytochrome c551
LTTPRAGEKASMKTSMRTLVSFLLLVATALLLAGCGGSDSDSGDDKGGTSGGGGSSSEGKSIFAETCGGCHTLSDAGTKGAVGPNLDDAKPDEDLVKTMIDNGGGAMPPGLLEGEERDAVAAYVAGAAGK